MKRLIREKMLEMLKDSASRNSFGDFVRVMIDGSLASDLFKGCKVIYPLRKVEIKKSEVIGALDIESLPEEKPKKKKGAKKDIVESDQDKIITEFTSIPGVGHSKAEALYNGGFRSIGALKDIPVNELGKVDKIGPSLAHKIKEHLKTLK